VAAVKNIFKKMLGRPLETDWRDAVPGPLLKRLPAGREITVVDVGAFDGDFTRALSQKFPVAHAVLVEAVPHRAEKLRAEFQAPRFTVCECAACDRAGMVEFELNTMEETSSLLKIHRDVPAIATLHLGAARTLRVEARTLDEITAPLGDIDVLKIDVQGAEVRVLSAGHATLARTRYIWIEVSFQELYEGSATFFEVYDALDRAGFGLGDLQSAFRGPSGEMLQGDALFLKK
jgi:FkbM family methyltransferase